MFDIGWGEWVLIFVLVLLFFALKNYRKWREVWDAPSINFNAASKNLKTKLKNRIKVDDEPLSLTLRPRSSVG